MGTVTARGASGVVYTFTQYFISGSWNDVPVIYMFAYQTIGGWVILYVGQAQSAKNRLPAHDRWADAVRKGATHVLALVASADESSRLEIERDLIAALQPALNTHHLGSAILTGGLRR